MLACHVLFQEGIAGDALKYVGKKIGNIKVSRRGFIKGATLATAAGAAHASTANTVGHIANAAIKAAPAAAAVASSPVALGAIAGTNAGHIWKAIKKKVHHETTLTEDISRRTFLKIAGTAAASPIANSISKPLSGMYNLQDHGSTSSLTKTVTRRGLGDRVKGMIKRAAVSRAITALASHKEPVHEISLSDIKEKAKKAADTAKDITKAASRKTAPVLKGVGTGLSIAGKTAEYTGKGLSLLGKGSSKIGEFADKISK